MKNKQDIETEKKLRINKTIATISKSHEWWNSTPNTIQSTWFQNRSVQIVTGSFNLRISLHRGNTKTSESKFCEKCKTIKVDFSLAAASVTTLASESTASCSHLRRFLALSSFDFSTSPFLPTSTTSSLQETFHSSHRTSW